MKFTATKVRISIIVCSLLLCIAWGSGAWFYELDQFKLRTNSLIDKENEHAGTRGETISADIRRSLKVMYGLPEVLASWQEVVNVLKPQQRASDAIKQRLAKGRVDTTLSALEQINHLLLLAKSDFSADVIWIMDANGNCVAASNFDLPTSFIGTNYKEREYFTSAMGGNNGYQFAVGKVSHQPGLYFSAPVYLKQKVIGVVVVKVDITRLAHNIDISNTFLVDENGVVILSDAKHLEMKVVPGNTIDKMSIARRLSVYQREQFELVQIHAWPDSRYARLTMIENSPEAYVLNITSINGGELKIYVLSPAKEIVVLDQEYFRLFLLVTLCGSALIIIAAGIIWYVHGNLVTSQILQMQHDELHEAQRLAQMGSWSYEYASRQLHCSDELIHNFFMLEKLTVKPTLDHILVNILPEDQERVKKVFNEGLKTGNGYTVEYRIMRKNGEIRNVIGKTIIEKNEKGQRIKVTGTCRDVTEEQRVLRAIEASENHLRRVLNSSLIGIIQGNDTGVICEMNKAFMALTGYTKAHLFENKLRWKDIAAVEYQQLDAANIFGQIDTPIPFEMELKCSDGKLLQVLIGLAKIEELRSEWVCFVLDLSERNRMSRLKSEFISIVSHELRTPLTSIRGSLALLEGGITGELEEKSMELVKIAHRNSRRLIDIVNDILDMEKLDAGKMVFEMRSIEITSAIRQAIEVNQAFAANLNVRYVMHSFPEPAYIWGDANRLMQILTNLLSNAAKFSPSGAEVELRLCKAEHHWRIEVHDTGPGIPEEFRGRIFGAFAQAEDANTRQKGGTGLGLNITKIMVEKMDGKIGFDSEEGQGATFWVSFTAL
ncbi:ATP-binding protein [Solimicrobium silvestre]|uniref:histidine kinase n=1 Tax=Solimicrobium silvestre TaxID=2099400 RepID=A0A2S9H1J6_9BURK|nr:ATP-binding protein [Solimicrobium silvestre]PRC93838.1 PAS domain S-box protein [Solimicrobium silvestre]